MDDVYHPLKVQGVEESYLIAVPNTAGSLQLGLMPTLAWNHVQEVRAVDRLPIDLALNNDREVQSNPLVTDSQSIFTFFTINTADLRQLACAWR